MKTSHIKCNTVTLPGRQLFFDDFVIEQSSLTRTFHRATPYKSNPVLRPETEIEMNNGVCPVSCPFGGGVFYDATDSMFKMWYMTGWFDSIGYAVSHDGIHWERKGLVKGIPGPEKGWFRDGCSVWLDNNKKNGERYTLFVYVRKKNSNKSWNFSWEEKNQWEHGKVFISTDGINWRHKCDVYGGGDNTSFFYDYKTQKWIFSYRSFKGMVRTRGFYSTENLENDIDLSLGEIYWQQASQYDEADPELNYAPQLYKLDAVAYESGYIGAYGIFLGPPNEICEMQKRPKIIDLKWAFSRNGKDFVRSSYTPFLSSSRKDLESDFGYLHIAGGIFCVVKDKLYIYYGAFSGQSPSLGRGMYSGGATHLAIMRRDGFVSLGTDKNGFLLTKPFFPKSYVFINADASNGNITAEVTDLNGNVLEGYDKKNCIPFSEDSTSAKISWHVAGGLPNNETIRIKFYLSNSHIYSFWFTDSIDGASMGHIAAGGPGFDCEKDTVGMRNISF